jgi:hypothetical protein
MKLGIQMDLAGLSLSNTISIIGTTRRSDGLYESLLS